MTPAQANLLRRVQADSQVRETDFQIIDMACTAFGWVRRDLHGCLALTPAGLAALADHDAGVK